MNLRRHRFDIPEDRKIERDPNGRFYLYESTGQRKMLVRDEAREYLKQSVYIDRQREDSFTHVSVGEQWIGHREFFEFGKDFVRIGRNELARDWKGAFGLQLPESHRSTAYNFLHGIELGLKAYLLFKDERLLPIDLKDKEHFGHNLQTLLINAWEYDLEIERCVVIPYGDKPENEEGSLDSMLENNWLEGIFGEASSEDERRFDIAIGTNFRRYAVKGTEYPIPIIDGQENYYLASIAGMAYTLFNKIRSADGFFDKKRRERNGEFDTWLQELHTQRKNFMLSEEDAVEKLAKLDSLFESCGDLPGPDKEPDWEEHLDVIRQSKGRRTANT
ncbi:MAG: hypothetical protein F4Z29_12010 [Gemmatimonadetes bacterium]|nr:hypothetical protein [Gemmatimonadota bacterium]